MHAVTCCKVPSEADEADAERYEVRPLVAHSAFFSRRHAGWPSCQGNENWGFHRHGEELWILGRVCHLIAAIFSFRDLAPNLPQQVREDVGWGLRSQPAFESTKVLSYLADDSTPT